MVKKYLLKSIPVIVTIIIIVPIILIFNHYISNVQYKNRLETIATHNLVSVLNNYHSINYNYPYNSLKISDVREIKGKINLIESSSRNIDFAFGNKKLSSISIELRKIITQIESGYDPGSQSFNDNYISKYKDFISLTREVAVSIDEVYVLEGADQHLGKQINFKIKDYRKIDSIHDKLKSYLLSL